MAPKIEKPRNKSYTTKGGSKSHLTWSTAFQPKWGGQYSRAQMFVDSEVLRTSEPFIPLLSGTMIKSGILGTDIGSGLVKWTTPYARRQYYSTRKPGSQTGPLRGPKWFERAKQVHKRNWIACAKQIAGSGGRA
jgi:hypothetical protein